VPWWSQLRLLDLSMSLLLSHRHALHRCILGGNTVLGEGGYPGHASGGGNYRYLPQLAQQAHHPIRRLLRQRRQ
jgi:hypothetical protein